MVKLRGKLGSALSAVPFERVILYLYYPKHNNIYLNTKCAATHIYVEPPEVEDQEHGAMGPHVEGGELILRL